VPHVASPVESAAEVGGRAIGITCLTFSLFWNGVPPDCRAESLPILQNIAALSEWQVDAGEASQNADLLFDVVDGGDTGMGDRRAILL
jgi:hypothetical protein